MCTPSPAHVQKITIGNKPSLSAIKVQVKSPGGTFTEIIASAEDFAPIRIMSAPNGTYNFFDMTYFDVSPGIVDPSAFTLPDICKSAKQTNERPLDHIRRSQK
eukprot:m.113535 g.113535  ORF g.113535 m.113535 type:complete len:103 (+) comp22885_c0_seq1:69-377(+)